MNFAVKNIMDILEIIILKFKYCNNIYETIVNNIIMAK